MPDSFHSRLVWENAGPSDFNMLRKAIKENWPIPPDVREAATSAIRRILANPGTEPRKRRAAQRAAQAMGL